MALKYELVSKVETSSKYGIKPDDETVVSRIELTEEQANVVLAAFGQPTSWFHERFFADAKVGTMEQVGLHTTGRPSQSNSWSSFWMIMEITKTN